MKLVNKNGKEVQLGDTVGHFSQGELYTLMNVTIPHKPSSTGSVHVEDAEGFNHSFYPSVFNLHWEGRTDQ